MITAIAEKKSLRNFCKKCPKVWEVWPFHGHPFCGYPFFRKILVSVKFVSAILGPDMGAPILWTPGKNAFFLQEKPMSIKFLVLGGGWVLGGGEVPILFLCARGFF